MLDSIYHMTLTQPWNEEHNDSVVECLTRGQGFWVQASTVSLRYALEQDTLILAYYWFNPVICILA